ncbi:MAG: Antidote-toxin recognition MazE, bacterial antitoxin [Acidobacteriaceae bacterium]|nr:Antidote-toxin recognition MazE, bacterial antitoxin [Acidobacteriaceae bacterium]
MRTSSIISSKGQIVIPANLRKCYGLKEGTTVTFQKTAGGWCLSPAITQRSMRSREALRISLSKRNWLRKEERSGSEKTNGERICSGLKCGAPISRRERGSRGRQSSCTLRTGRAWSGAAIDVRN